MILTLATAMTDCEGESGAERDRAAALRSGTAGGRGRSDPSAITRQHSVAPARRLLARPRDVIPSCQMDLCLYVTWPLKVQEAPNQIQPITAELTMFLQKDNKVKFGKFGSLLQLIPSHQFSERSFNKLLIS